MEILKSLEKELSAYKAQLVAVSKTKPVSAIQELYDAGQRIFGENRVQELVEKENALPKDIQWQMIGRLQTNKVKQIASFIDLIHSVDSERLLLEINKRAKMEDRVIDCLLQFFIAEESTKQGFSFEEAQSLLKSPVYLSLQNIRIKGVMGMATFTSNHDQVRSEFARLRGIFEQLKAEHFPESGHFTEISMGMSGDYALALEEGSTLVRIGSLLFGTRNYH